MVFFEIVTETVVVVQKPSIHSFNNRQFGPAGTNRSTWDKQRKTKMKINHSNRSQIKIGNYEIEFINSFCYLESIITTGEEQKSAANCRRCKAKIFGARKTQKHKVQNILHMLVCRNSKHSSTTFYEWSDVRSNPKLQAIKRYEVSRNIIPY